MRKSIFVLGLIFAAAAGLFIAGCDQIQNMLSPNLGSKNLKPSVQVSTEEVVSPVQGTVLAKINNEVITVEAFDDMIKAIKSASPEAKIDTLDEKKEFLNSLIGDELLYQEAKVRGVDKKKDVRDAMKKVIAQQLVLDETRGIVVQESEINEFYNQYKKQLFTTPEEVKVREIVVASEPAGKEILISLLQGADFAATAKEKSVAPTATNGGEVPPFKQGDKFDKYFEVMATLEEGQVSPLFKGPDGWYIIKTDQKKSGTTYALADKIPGTEMTVRDYINNYKMQQKQIERIKALTDKLRSEAKVDIKEDLLR